MKHFGTSQPTGFYKLIAYTSQRFFREVDAVERKRMSINFYPWLKKQIWTNRQGVGRHVRLRAQLQHVRALEVNNPTDRLSCQAWPIAFRTLEYLLSPAYCVTALLAIHQGVISSISNHLECNYIESPCNGT